MRVRTRFAPSPTGNLHIGGARTALFNWIWAKKWKGSFVLRIEDTDKERSSMQFEESIKNDLLWLGLNWDEGPDVGGPYGPYRQSDRFGIYHDVLEKLKDLGCVYPCYCTVEELESERENQLAKGLPPKYSGRCRNLSDEERKKLEEAGRLPSWRFKVPQKPGKVEFYDEVHKHYALSYREVGDFILVRSDGIPTYIFAAVVDDHYMQITHVIRGDEHLPNTVRQVLLYQALSWDPPSFAHIPMILSREGRKLSKREGAEGISELREKGYLPEAVRAYLATLSWAVEGEDFLFDPDAMAQAFDLCSISRSSPIHDENRLRWWGNKAIKQKDALWLAERLMAIARERDLKPSCSSTTLASLLPEALSDQATIIEVFDSLIWLFMRPQKSDEMPLWMEELAKELSGVGRWDKEEIERVLKAFQRKLGIKAKEFFHPIRMAITGSHWGPPLPLVMEVLGKDEVLFRLKQEN